MWLVSYISPRGNTQPGSKYFDFEIIESFSNRFMGDKCCVKDKLGFYIQDGVLLNKYELLGSGFQDLTEYIADKRGKELTYFSKFKGPFSGCCYCESSNTFVAFGNQTGDTSVFYYCEGENFAVSTDFNEVVKWCKAQDIKLSFNETASNHLLSLGFITEGNTIVTEIKKTNPGECLILKDGYLKIETYHKFVFGEYNITTMDEAIELVDRQFRESVRLCMDKDLEYGYSHHLADISGGLDSRMTNWIAREMGYEKLFNTCYAQSGSNEEVFGRKVAEQLDNEFYFEPLENLEFVFDLEKLIRMNYGLSVYAGITGGERLLSHLDFNKYGLEHTGQLGDVVLGYKGDVLRQNGTINTDAISYSTIIRPVFGRKGTPINGEEFAFYYRFFHGTLATHYIRRYYTEAVSPFIDIDFAQLCFHIDSSLRANHKLYWEWIKRKYPKAYEIPSTRSKESKRMKLYHVLPSNVSRAIIRTCKKLGLARLVSDKHSMNPFDLWYENNAEMRTFINNYYHDHIEEMDQYPDTVQQLKTVFEQGRTMDKLLVLTVLAAHSIYLNESMTA